MNPLFRKLEDLCNELAHIQAFPGHYTHVERLLRRINVVARIRELRRIIRETRKL